MPQCKNCQRPTTFLGAKLCEGCLNNWLVMRKAIQQRLIDIHGEVTRAKMPLLQNEMDRLNKLWKRDRQLFEKEANSWYDNKPADK